MDFLSFVSVHSHALLSPFGLDIEKWNGLLPTSWALNDPMLLMRIMAARRSASCVTGPKPGLDSVGSIATTTTAASVAASTLPSGSVVNAFGFPPISVDNAPRLPYGPSLLSSSCSSSSSTSRTATSGVALTAGSLSSENTTRPSSLAISWPPPLTEEGSDVDEQDVSGTCDGTCYSVSVTCVYIYLPSLVCYAHRTMGLYDHYVQWYSGSSEAVGHKLYLNHQTWTT